jgi:acetylornithine deacetylase/succinyl-diaminopimelate desuccinylase-like protein
MVPSALVRLDALPLTPHGKVDHRALPPPGEALRPEEIHYVAPRSATEQLIAGVWREVLGIDTLGIDDPFFDVGGSSLSIAVAANLLETTLERPVPVLALFRYPTVRSLAEHLSGEDPLGESRLLEQIGHQAQERVETRDLRRQRRSEHRF